MNKNKKVDLVIFDWAGTTVDYGCMAPFVIFKKTFEEKNITLMKEEILAPMGMEKKEHIRSILKMERVTALWEQVYKRAWNEEDVQGLYEAFESSLASVVAAYSKPIEGVVETVEKLRQMGIKIGSTTGYTSAMMEHVTPKAKEQGYVVDYLVTPEKVGVGRPSPFMIYECMRHFQSYPVKTVVKVGDTVMDILEGVNAGTYTVGILEGSSEVGLSQEEMSTLSEAEIQLHKDKARKAYLEAGADFVIENIKDLVSVILELNER